MKTLNHPHIIKYIDSFIIEKDETLVIVMDYCEEGDLAHHISKKQKKKEHFPEKLILNWFLQILMALDFIHKKKILHRDIKSSNIFLTTSGTVKIGDFGISKLLNSTTDDANTMVGTPYYMSPEVVENQPYSYKSDIWALGCVLYELCTLGRAFKADNLLGLVVKIVKEEQDPIPSIYSAEMRMLVESLLRKKSSDRPTLEIIRGIPFIQKTIKVF